MKKGICPFCGKEVDKFIMFRGDIVGCRYCGISVKQTNADRIRSMTDEELAKWLASFVHCDCPAVHHRGCGSEECDVPWLDWLKRWAE